MQRLRFYVGVFLISASGLMLQLIQTRILSVVLWYYLAFLIIGMAMFGITAGAVWVYLRRERFTEQTLPADLTYFSAALAVATAVCAALQMTLPVASSQGFTDLIAAAELALCLAIPFFLSGVVLSLALTRSRYPVGRVYGVDLGGAAAGCLGVLALLNVTDAPNGLLWVAVIAALGAVSFAGSTEGVIAPAMPLGGLLSRTRTIFVLLVLCAGLGATTHGAFRPLFVKGEPETGEQVPIFSEWNTFARVTVRDKGVHPPAMWGPSASFRGENWAVAQRDLSIDGVAGSTAYRFDGDLAHVGFLKDDVINLAHYLPGHQRAAVIGVGGGRDMLSARAFGVPDVTGVEINPILVRLLTTEPGFADFSALTTAGGLHFENDEARSWFARSRDKFDIIQMSLVDTWAATGAGAFTLSENGLYTVEAWKIFLNHLTPNGVFTVSRWYAPGYIDEAGRTISVAVAALYELGVKDPRQHIFLAASTLIGTLIISREPLSADNLAVLKKIAAEKQYRVLLSPDGIAATEVLRQIADSPDRASLVRYTADLPLDLTPSTDERPFFFNQLPLSSPTRLLALLRHGPTEGVAYGNISAAKVLLQLNVISLLLVVITIVLPLRPAISDAGRTLTVAGTAYFLLLGLGFMFAEIGMLQRLSVFLGSPIYALSIVLFSLILATGIGSLVSGRISFGRRGQLLAWAALTGIYLVVLPFWLPAALDVCASGPLLLRAALCVAVTAPAGVLMGFGFPLGMRLVQAIDRRPTPWFWGINGAAGVFASSLAVALSTAFGIYTVLIAGGVCYVLLIPAGLALGRRPISR
jgi:spermidine synthase